MLVLSRQRDESIMIGDNIVVTIVDIRGDKVRLRDQCAHGDPRPSAGGLRSNSARESKSLSARTKGYAAARPKRTPAQRARHGSTQARPLIFAQSAIRLILLPFTSKCIARRSQSSVCAPCGI